MERTGSKPIDELIRLARIGDGTAFTALWDTHIGALRSYIRSTVKGVDDFYIDDICSKSFEKAFRQISSYDPSRSQFITWLRTIAHNTALDTIESESRGARQMVSLDISSPQAEDMADDAVSSPLDSIIHDEDTSETQVLIDGLPAIYRDVARCRFIEEMQYKEIADELQMELNTVRTRIRRAKAIMDKAKDERAK